MATEAAIPINTPRDTVQRIHRTTREKRSLWYQLTVLQQPERARACGAGSKAHSDRRPVDPPPVVELRIIEGESADNGKDITFDYNANFFLFASLENSRPMAHGRVQTAAAQSPPILTGVPCSGMAYLDRPISAGYFIFPDLSIRHEGNYVLNFNLFETTKEEKDFDLDPTEPDLPLGVDFRMEIKTNPFQVYSAKKFPGLMESTQLSKTVADQGCRVRIRRDVRMRKRDGKSNNYNNREENFAARQPPKAVTPAPEDPHAAALRARSLSNSSEHRVPYGPDAHRRPSAADVYAAPPPPGYEPATTANRGHLAFGDPNAVQYAAPRQPISHGGPQLAPVSPVGPYAPNGHPTPTHSNYQSSRPLSRAGHGSVAPMGQDSYERRLANHPTPSPTVYSSMDPHSRRDSGASYPPTPTSHHSPRITLPHNAYGPTAQQMKISALVTLAPISDLPPPPPSQTHLPPIEAQTEAEIPPPDTATGGKRKHDVTFYQSDTPLHNGQRQQDPHYDGRVRHHMLEPFEARWSRADGSVGITRFNEFR